MRNDTRYTRPANMPNNAWADTRAKLEKRNICVWTQASSGAAMFRRETEPDTRMNGWAKTYTAVYTK